MENKLQGASDSKENGNTPTDEDDSEEGDVFESSKSENDSTQKKELEDIEKKASKCQLSVNEYFKYDHWCKKIIHPILMMQTFFVWIGGIYCWFCYHFPPFNADGEPSNAPYIGSGVKPDKFSRLERHSRESNETHKNCVLSLIQYVLKNRNKVAGTAEKRSIARKRVRYTDFEDDGEEDELDGGGCRS